MSGSSGDNKLVELIRCVGELVYGEFWQRPMAEAVEVTTRTMNRWAQGHVQPPTDPRLLRKLTTLVNRYEREQPRRLARVRSMLEKQVAVTDRLEQDERARLETAS